MTIYNSTFMEYYMHIYKIENISNGMFYIGQTCGVPEKRWKMHKYQLNKQIHGNPKLQAAWNTYGESLFEFYIIDTASDSNTLDELEIKYISDYCNTNQLYNLKMGGRDGYIVSDDTKIRMSNAKTSEIRKSYSERMKKNNPMENPESRAKAKIGADKGRLAMKTQESRDKMRLVLQNVRPSAKLSIDQVKSIRLDYINEHSYSKLAKKYNVGPSTIGRIITNKTWTFVENCNG